MNTFTAAANAQQQALSATTEYFEKTPKLAEQIERVSDIEVGMTPSEVIYEENKLQLLHYKPEEAGIEPETTHDVPILIVYALINKPYILDLQPDRSVVRRLLENGFDVYLIDWGEPSRLDAHLTLDDYVSRYIDNCVDVVRDRSGQESINLFGYCMGGTMSVMYASLFPEKVRNLGLMAAGLCFDETGGVLELWGGKEFYDAKTVTDTFGNVPADFLDIGFAMMDPISNYVTKYMRLYDNVEDDEFVENFARMERWLGEGIDVAGKTYQQFIEDIYQDNKLARNELSLDDKHVDLGNIEMPIVQVVGDYDHLIPPESSTEFNDLVPSEDITTIDASTGHIGLSVSSSSHSDLWPSVAEWFAERSQPDDEPEPESESESESESETAAEPEPEPEVDAETDTEADIEPEPDTEAVDTESTASEAEARSVEPETAEEEPDVTDDDVEDDVVEDDMAEDDMAEDDMAEDDVTEDDESAAEESEDDTDESSFSQGIDRLESIRGIGPHYAEQLRGAGVDSISALIAADAESLADQISASSEQIHEWIESADEYDE